MALRGKQKNIDMNNNNRIDAEDFAILKRKKAKPMKAALGAIALGLGAKKIFDKKKDSIKDLAGMTGIGASAKIMKKKKEILGRMGGGMMMRTPEYKKGKSVMARGCKLGRKKPTKMY